MRKIASPEEYSVRVVLARDAKTWRSLIERRGQVYPVQRSTRKYRTGEDARAAADMALGAFIEGLQIVKAKQR